MPPMRASLLALLLPLGAGCADPVFPRPMTARALVREDSGPAPVAYLEHPDASAAVCAPKSSGAHLASFDEDKYDALVRGLVAGRISTGVWQKCAASILRTRSAQVA